jgi:hypothetical protein
MTSASPAAAATVEAAVAAVVREALAQLAAAGVAGAPPIALAAGDHCAAVLADFVARCRDPRARVRVSDSLGIEGSHLLQALARERPGGVPAFVVATVGEAAWRQACAWSIATLAAGEAQGTIACGVRDGVACALAPQLGEPPLGAPPDPLPAAPFCAAFDAVLAEWAAEDPDVRVRRGPAFACRVVPAADAAGASA